MHAERILMIGLVLLGVAFVAGGQSLDFRADIAFGPGFVPVVAAIGLTLCCVLQLVRTARSSVGRNAVGDAHGVEKAPPEGADYRSLWLAMAILVAGVSAMSLGSVLLPVFIIAALLSWWVSGHGLLRAVMVAVAIITVIYVIFALWLGLPVR